jgi:hypothetical protein
VKGFENLYQKTRLIYLSLVWAIEFFSESETTIGRWLDTPVLIKYFFKFFAETLKNFSLSINSQKFKKSQPNMKTTPRKCTIGTNFLQVVKHLIT